MRVRWDQGAGDDLMVALWLLVLALAAWWWSEPRPYRGE